jgi:drug/metabolite transporter (DMT)-like permease
MSLEEENYGGFGLPFAVLIISGWASINLALNFFNSFALRPEDKGGLGFSFPFVYSGFHQVASFIGVNVIFKVKPKLNTLSRAQWHAKWPALLGLSVMMVLNIGCNNASLVYVGLSINQIIKSITPLPTMILSYFSEKKTYSWTIIGVVLLQVIGAVVAVPWHDRTQAAAIGILLCFVSMLAAATKPVVAGALMKDMRESGLTPLVLVWYDSLFSIGWFFFIALCLRYERTGAVEYMRDNAAVGWGLILIGSTMAFAYNIVVFYLTKVTSALTNVVLANVKQVILIVVAAIFVDHISRWWNVMGIVIFFLASFVYSYITFTNKPPPSRTSSRTSVTKPSDESTGLVKGKS